MTTFIQLHLLTAYAPSNLNRDDTGRPKTAKMGGVDRLRISSQSLKRAWRISDVFAEQTGKDNGIRTRRVGKDWVLNPMLDAGISPKKATSVAESIARQFGKLKSGNVEIEQVAHISNYEAGLIKELVNKLIAENREPTEEELKLLRKTQRDVDMALFGRMLASSPDFNVDAACQVAHALGVSAVTVEDDFFTAVDDLTVREDEQGSAHMGEQGFASALFYTYICISRNLLLENLEGNEELTDRAIAALTEAAMTVAPTGKQNSFASRAYASYVLAEKGSRQPRSLAVAFFQPVKGENQLETAIERLQQQRDKFDRVYGVCADRRYELNVVAETGSLQELLDFVRG